MDSRGFLFIPDISGFTRFIQQAEIEHSRYIISELLEILINSNELNLSVSEIEGDAVLFYRFGEPPSLDQISHQVEAMFCNFHRHLNGYSKHRICQCRACQTADQLTLKIISHAGEFSTYRVKEFNKLIGKDVIVAHRLLKNDIPEHEYWLVTNDLILNGDKGNALPGKMEWLDGEQQGEFGITRFNYAHLGYLKASLTVETGSSPDIPVKGKEVMKVQKLFDEDPDKLYAIIGDIRHRPRWRDGLQDTKNISTSINQVGTLHHCVLDRGTEILVTSNFRRDEGSILLEETDPQKKVTLSYHLQKKDGHKTLLTFRVYLRYNPVMLLFFNLLMKQKLIKSEERSMKNLEEFAKTAEAASCFC